MMEMKEKKANHELVFQVPVYAGTVHDLRALLSKWLGGVGQMKVVVTPNPEQLVLAEKRPDFLRALQDADLALPDGIGLVWAGRILHRSSQRQVFPERMPGRQVFEELVGESAKRNLTVLLVGGYGTVAAKAADRLRKQYPGLAIAGLSGPKDSAHASDSEQLELQKILREFRPHLVGVAFGAPKQELWMMEHKKLLEESGVRLVMAIGGTLDVLAGTLLPAPVVFEKAHLEWLFRLMQQPSRWKRQLALPVFAGKVLRAWLSRH